MKKRIIITGKYNDGKQSQTFIGEIEVLNFDHKHETAYVTWKIENEQNLEIASLTKNYFLGKVNNHHEEIIILVSADIQNYRMNRRKVFSEIRINERINH